MNLFISNKMPVTKQFAAMYLFLFYLSFVMVSDIILLRRLSSGFGLQTAPCFYFAWGGDGIDVFPINCISQTI